jgi:hypothetical protein
MTMQMTDPTTVEEPIKIDYFIDPAYDQSFVLIEVSFLNQGQRIDSSGDVASTNSTSGLMKHWGNNRMGVPNDHTIDGQFGRPPKRYEQYTDSEYGAVHILAATITL